MGKGYVMEISGMVIAMGPSSCTTRLAEDKSGDVFSQEGTTATQLTQLLSPESGRGVAII
jgi:hypothetical protein